MGEMSCATLLICWRVGLKRHYRGRPGYRNTNRREPRCLEVSILQLRSRLKRNYADSDRVPERRAKSVRRYFPHWISHANWRPPDPPVPDVPTPPNSSDANRDFPNPLSPVTRYPERGGWKFRPIPEEPPRELLHDPTATMMTPVAISTPPLFGDNRYELYRNELMRRGDLH